VTDIACSAEISNNSADFLNNASMQKNYGPQPFIKVSLFASESKITIQLTSCMIDARKVVCSFIESDKKIDKYVSVTKDFFLIQNLSTYIEEPMWMLALKPLKPCKELFTRYDNSMEIIFEDCDEYVVGEFF
jgi:hypothetical protein